MPKVQYILICTSFRADVCKSVDVCKATEPLLLPKPYRRSLPQGFATRAEQEREIHIHYFSTKRITSHMHTAAMFSPTRQPPTCIKVSKSYQTTSKKKATEGFFLEVLIILTNSLSVYQLEKRGYPLSYELYNYLIINQLYIIYKSWYPSKN